MGNFYTLFSGQKPVSNACKIEEQVNWKGGLYVRGYGNSGKKNKCYVIWNKIIEQEFQNIFCHSLAISIHILVLPLLFYMT